MPFPLSWGSLEAGMGHTGPAGSFLLFLGANAIMSNRRKFHDVFHCVLSSDETAECYCTAV